MRTVLANDFFERKFGRNDFSSLPFSRQEFAAAVGYVANTSSKGREMLLFEGNPHLLLLRGQGSRTRCH